MSEQEKSDFSRISPTAFMTCMAKQFSGIPYSREIAERAIIQQSPYLPMLVESRYRAINREAEKHKITQVLELASGFLPRGMEMTSDPRVTFVESDLPETIATKRELCGALIGGRENLRFADLDATSSPSDFLEATGHFKEDERILVLCEGLLMYLTHEEKVRVCAGVHSVLRRHGGVWITTDFTPLADRSKENGSMMKRLRKITGRSLADNAFETLDSACGFLAERGFTVEAENLTAIAGGLCCARSVLLPPGVVERILSTHFVFTISAQSGMTTTQRSDAPGR